MKITKEQKLELNIKLEKLNNLKIYLKNEFVGIDSIIDKVTHSIYPFYLFPNSLSKPVVINLWGMTGCGKTSLVNELVKFLKLENSYMRFDVAELESNNQLILELKKKTKDLLSTNNIFVFDEFQTSRTINEKGEENNKSSLRPIWELLDSGKIQVSNSDKKRVLFSILNFFKNLQDNNVVVEGGIVLSQLDYFHKKYVNLLKKISQSSHSTFGFGLIFEGENSVRVNDFKKVTFKDNNMEGVIGKHAVIHSVFDLKEHDHYIFEKPLLIRSYLIDVINEIIPSFSEKYEDIRSKDLEDVIYVLKKEIDKVNYTEVIDFSKSLIFCLGNLDECYSMSHEIEPDDDADVFYEHSLTISTPKIKKALGLRFRMEQISRLGNNHIIYPSINKKSYQKIIQLLINKQIDELKNTFNIDAEFDSTVNEIIYKEGVYPTQGVRPVISTFNVIIKSYIANLLTTIALEMDSANKMFWKFDSNKNKHIIIVSNKSERHTFIFDVDCELEMLRKSDNSENQTLVAVHESGHALITCIQLEIAPTEVLSKTANSSEGFCRYQPPKMQTKEYIFGEIMVCLGGRIAEEIIFGKENTTTGANSDLKRATVLAHSLVKKYGMHDTLVMISSVVDSDMFCNYFKTEDYDRIVFDVVEKATKKVKKILKKHKNKLIEMSVYLSSNSKIEQGKIKDMMSDLNIKWRDVENYYNFKDMLLNSLNKK